MKTEIAFSWNVLGGDPTPIVLEVADIASRHAPLIILLHGTSGTINDMSDPATFPGFNYERISSGTLVERGWHSYPNVGFWSLGPDALTPVTGWAPFLVAAGFATLNYQQTKPREVLIEPLQELLAICEAIETDDRFLLVRHRHIILMGHSRGGILARMLLVELAATGAAILGRIRMCITLHAPNQGSMVANTALALAAMIEGWRISGVPGLFPGLQPAALQALDDLLAYMGNQIGASAYTDFVVGSPTLIRLAAAEPVPGIMYYTFGGTRPVLLNLRGWAFTPESSALVFGHDPPFHWVSTYVPLMPLPPPMLVPFPELLNGDVLTNSTWTRLPFAVHQDNYINHAEALWDQALKAQVIAILALVPPTSLPLPGMPTPDISYLDPLLLSGPA